MSNKGSQYNGDGGGNGVFKFSIPIGFAAGALTFISQIPAGNVAVHSITSSQTEMTVVLSALTGLGTMALINFAHWIKK